MLAAETSLVEDILQRFSDCEEFTVHLSSKFMDKMTDFITEVFPEECDRPEEDAADVAIRLLEELLTRRHVAETEDDEVEGIRTGLEQVVSAMFDVAIGFQFYALDDRPKRLTSQLPPICTKLMAAVEAAELVVSYPDDLDPDYLKE